MATGPLHRSAAAARLSHHRLCLPARLEISPLVHELLGHTGWVYSVGFSGDGREEGGVRERRQHLCVCGTRLDVQALVVC